MAVASLRKVYVLHTIEYCGVSMFFVLGCLIYHEYICTVRADVNYISSSHVIGLWHLPFQSPRMEMWERQRICLSKIHTRFTVGVHRLQSSIESCDHFVVFKTLRPAASLITTSSWMSCCCFATALDLPRADYLNGL